MMRPLRVLLVEDSADDAALTLRALDHGGLEATADQMQSHAEMRAALAREPWDVVISDHSMPSFDALSALRMLREADEDTPFIIVSGTIGEEVAVAAMSAGASDYVMKDNLARLPAAVERELVEAEVRRERRRAERVIRSWASIFETAAWASRCSRITTTRSSSSTIEMLCEYGVDYAQGYYVGRPEPLPAPA
jgi:DNA-binding NtrC family response regulator